MRVLIVEDDPLISMDLQDIVESQGHHVVGAVCSVGDAREHLSQSIDYALLDVDVADGKTFPIAHELLDRHIPFAFVSASAHADVPERFQSAEFIEKPYEGMAILRSIAMGDNS